MEGAGRGRGRTCWTERGEERAIKQRTREKRGSSPPRTLGSATHARVGGDDIHGLVSPPLRCQGLTQVSHEVEVA